MIPFMTEDIYRNLVCSIDKSAPESIHLCDYPVVDEKLIDKKLEADMDEVLKVVVLGRACRNEANIKNRQPIGKMFVKAPEKLDEFYVDIIADELNVKRLSSLMMYHTTPPTNSSHSLEQWVLSMVNTLARSRQF